MPTDVLGWLIIVGLVIGLWAGFIFGRTYEAWRIRRILDGRL